MASFAKNFQVVAPIGYGSEGPYRLPSTLFGYFAFSPQRDCTALPLYHCRLQKMYAMPPLNTTQSGTQPGTTPPHLMQCFVATIRRRHPPKRFRNHVYHLFYWQNLHHGSPAIAFSIMLLPPFSCEMDAGAEAGVEGVVFAACRAREVLVVEFTRLLANRGLARRQRRRLRVLYRGTSGRTGHRVPRRCACGLSRPRLAHLAFDVLVDTTPAISSAYRSDHVRRATHCFTTSSHGTPPQLTRAMLCTAARTPQSHEHVLVVSSSLLLSTTFTLSFFVFFGVLPFFFRLKSFQNLKS